MTSEPSNNQTARVLPDMEICRASDLMPEFADCLVERPTACPYAMSFGCSFLCKHPDRKTIIANTKRLREQNQLH
jgi:hypothetical protein